MSPTAFAALAAAAATAFYAASTLMAKALGAGALGAPLAVFQVTQARFVFGFLALLAVARFLPGTTPGGQAPPPAWGLHLARSVLGWLGAALLFAAAARMPLSDANALAFLSPMATMLLAIPFLGERVGPWRWAAAAIAFAGMLVLMRPGEGAVQPAALFALGAALAMGVEGIFIKKLAGRESPRQILLVNNAMGALIASAVGVWVFQWPESPAVWLALAAVGLFMVTGQFLNLLAQARGDASYLAPFMYLTLVWAMVYDIAVFGVWPDRVSVLGAAVIASGGLVMAWREARARRG